tara:strand:+ start:234 stop:515 length:282 start_codon:yes stop_codon:yes gene_type:complete
MKEGKNIPNLEALFQVGGHIKFKIIQDGFCLLGQGTTPDEACEDAIEWIDDDYEVTDVEGVREMLTKPSERFHGCITMLYIGDEDFNDYKEQQ